MPETKLVVVAKVPHRRAVATIGEVATFLAHRAESLNRSVSSKHGECDAARARPRGTAPRSVLPGTRSSHAELTGEECSQREATREVKANAPFVRATLVGRSGHCARIRRERRGREPGTASAFRQFGRQSGLLIRAWRIKRIGCVRRFGEFERSTGAVERRHLSARRRRSENGRASSPGRRHACYSAAGRARRRSEHYS